MGFVIQDSSKSLNIELFSIIDQHPNWLQLPVEFRRIFKFVIYVRN